MRLGRGRRVLGRLAIAIGALAAVALPMPAVAYAAADFWAPAQGATFSGVVPRGTQCNLWASSDTTRVDFYLNGQSIGRLYSAPWTCTFDSRQFADGAYTLRAVGLDTGGRTSSTSAQIRIVNAASGSQEDSQAAAMVRRSPWEPRPANTNSNNTMPTRVDLERFYAADSWGSCESLRRRVTGAFTGTTDEIIQWAAYKWGVAPDLLRAVAVQESYWNQFFSGDPNAGGSHGLCS